MHNQKIQNQITNLKTNFPWDLYNRYLQGDIKYSQLLQLLNCSDYIFKIVIQDMSLYKRRQYNNTMTNHAIFDNINTEYQAYILGFYIADGCICNSEYITFALNQQDVQILTDIKNIINPNAKISFYKERINKHGIKTHPIAQFKVHSKHIFDTLQNYGLGCNKTYLQKSIANIIPKELMWHFIRGYFDGDGMIGRYLITKKHQCKNGVIKKYYSYNYNYTIISHDQCILQEILDFYKSEGINAIIYQEQRSGNYLVGSHSLCEIKKVFNKLYENSTIYLQRKYYKFRQIIENTEVISEINKLLTPQSVESETHN